ncbi:MAG: hypothetical protein AABZ12_12030 [Planctomycetota bacterium]
MDGRGLAILATVISLGGCLAPPRSFIPPVDPTRLDDVAFVHYLANTPTATVAEGARAVLLLVGSTSQWPLVEAQLDELTRRGAVKPAWRLAPDQTLDRGTLAFMLRTLCGLPRGINEKAASLTGLGDRRYAVRACADAGLLSYGLPHDPVSGGELVTALRNAEGRVNGNGLP